VRLHGKIEEYRTIKGQQKTTAGIAGINQQGDLIE